MTTEELDHIASLAEKTAGMALELYGREDWQDSPLVEDLARAAIMLRDARRQVPEAEASGR